jgi:hypothetical protein
VKGRAKTAVRREFMATYNISATTLSRVLHEVGYRERQRADAGQRRNGLATEDLAQMAAIQRASLSARKGVILPAEDAINIAEDSGLIQKGVISTSAYNAWLRDEQSSRRQQAEPEPHTTLRSLGPNHVHQVDFSLAVNWKIFQGKPVYEHLVYKNKLPSAGVPRLWRLLIVDHTTGVIFPWYSESTGETVQATLEGLYRAWSPKTLRGESVERRYPFRGVPKILMADRGSANQAKITATTLERLGVQLNICIGARSKGSVEVSHNIWEQHFEARMRLQVPTSVEQLNEWALDFAVKFCAEKVHSRYNAARSAMWAWHINRLPETQLRELRCDFETFKGIALSDPQKCLVRGDRTIRFRTKRYRIPAEVTTGQHVAVQYSVFDFPNILVRDAAKEHGPAWLCEPMELDEFGQPLSAPIIGQEFKAHKHTATKRFVTAADEIAKGYVDSQQLRVFGHHAEGVEEIEVKHRGTDVLAVAGTAEPTYTNTDARFEVLQRVGRDLLPAEKRLFQRFGATVTEDEIDAVVSAIAAGVENPVVPMIAARA